jgi:hypothetical protein
VSYPGLSVVSIAFDHPFTNRLTWVGTCPPKWWAPIAHEDSHPGSLKHNSRCDPPKVTVHVDSQCLMIRSYTLMVAPPSD